jgi:hypothetical protein
MNELKYVPVRRRSREQISLELRSGDPKIIHDALISAGYWDDDWKWAQEQLLRFADNENEAILWGVAMGLGYIAIFHGEIDVQVVQPILARMKKAHPSIADVIENTEEDIEQEGSLWDGLAEDWVPPSQRPRN